MYRLYIHPIHSGGAQDLTSETWGTQTSGLVYPPAKSLKVFKT